MDLTFLEIRVPELPIDVGTRQFEAEETPPAGPGSPGGRGLGQLVAIGVVVGMALLARYYRRSEATPGPSDASTDGAEPGGDAGR